MVLVEEVVQHSQGQVPLQGLGQHLLRLHLKSNQVRLKDNQTTQENRKKKKKKSERATNKGGKPNVQFKQFFVEQPDEVVVLSQNSVCNRFLEDNRKKKKEKKSQPQKKS